jgi:S-adenosylmethionine/arginine decarboxylase-like enzyme
MSAPHKEFGAELILDLHGCDPEIIRSRKKLAEFARRLVRRIKMVAYGKPFLAHFGHKNPVTSGYSLVQLIETSSITAHFSEGKNSVYMNIFSCRAFDKEDAKAFCKKFFRAKRVHNRYIVRK